MDWVHLESSVNAGEMVGCHWNYFHVPSHWTKYFLPEVCSLGFAQPLAQRSPTWFPFALGSRRSPRSLSTPRWPRLQQNWTSILDASCRCHHGSLSVCQIRMGHDYHSTTETYRLMVDGVCRISPCLYLHQILHFQAHKIERTGKGWCGSWQPCQTE